MAPSSGLLLAKLWFPQKPLITLGAWGSLSSLEHTLEHSGEGGTLTVSSFASAPGVTQPGHPASSHTWSSLFIFILLLEKLRLRKTNLPVL